MILELVDIHIVAGQGAQFEAAVRQAIATVVSKATGFRGLTVHQGIESPDRYVLMLSWDTLENHTVDFQKGPLFPQWRAIVGPFFASPPAVAHFNPATEPA